MEVFTLNKLWELRGELDKVVASGDYDRIKDVSAKYQVLVDRAWHYNRAFISYNYAFSTISDRQMHNANNVVSILKNIENFEKKYIEGEDVSVKLKSPHRTPFLAGEIWILRAMYDKFLVQGVQQQDGFFREQNMILGKAVQDRLVTLARMEQTDIYYDQIKPIIEEVRDGYESVYGKEQPRLDYSQLRSEFLEK